MHQYTRQSGVRNPSRTASPQQHGSPNTTTTTQSRADSQPTGNKNQLVGGRRLRGSCDFCTRRKRKCDGDGINRCSLCVAKNQAVCHYSVRLPTGPRRDAPSSTSSLSACRDKPAESLSCVKSKRVISDDCPEGGWRQSSPGSTAAAAAAGYTDNRTLSAVAAGSHSRGLARLSLKRARLSPSPATGLVGLQENVYIEDFFRVMGFLPFTSESIIRTAMVNTMLGHVRLSGGYSLELPWNQGEDEAEAVEGQITLGGSQVQKSEAEVAAAACSLWSTVAIGYLVRGRPRETVYQYAHLAREALAACFDEGSAEIARAFLAMAILQNFLGDEEKYQKHVDFAASLLKVLPPEEVTSDIRDTLTFLQACNMFHDDSSGFMTQFGGDSTFNGRDPSWYQRDKEDMDDVGFCVNGHYPPRRHRQTGWELEGRTDLITDEGTGEVIPLDKLDPPPPGERSRQFAADATQELQMLESATQSADVRDGVGELYLRSLLAYASSLDGDHHASFNNITRCADLLILHPGLCRFDAWAHLAHCVVACLALTGARVKYAQMQHAYNSVLDDRRLAEVPPFEEWVGISTICNGYFCRSLDTFFTTAAKRIMENLDSKTAPPWLVDENGTFVFQAEKAQGSPATPSLKGAPIPQGASSVTNGNSRSSCSLSSTTASGQTVSEAIGSVSRAEREGSRGLGGASGGMGTTIVEEEGASSSSWTEISWDGSRVGGEAGHEEQLMPLPLGAGESIDDIHVAGEDVESLLQEVDAFLGEACLDGLQGDFAAFTERDA